MDSSRTQKSALLSTLEVQFWSEQLLDIAKRLTSDIAYGNDRSQVKIAPVGQKIRFGLCFGPLYDHLGHLKGPKWYLIDPMTSQHLELTFFPLMVS